MSGRKNGRRNDEKELKVMTPSEFIESRPKEIELTESIEPKEEEVRGLFKWIGHIHEEDIDNLIEAIQTVYSELELRKFQKFTGLFEQGGIWEVKSGEPDETSYIYTEGTHGIGELYFFWNRPRKDVLEKMKSASKIFVEESRKNSCGVTLTNGFGFEDWRFGSRWRSSVHEGEKESPKPFVDSERITIFLEQKGNRDYFKYRAALPASRWIFFNYRSDEHGRISELLTNCYDEMLKGRVLQMNVESRISKYILGKNRGQSMVSYKVRFEASDLDFDDYRGLRSALDLASDFTRFFEKADLRCEDMTTKNEKVRLMPGSVLYYPRNVPEFFEGKGLA